MVARKPNTVNDVFHERAVVALSPKVWQRDDITEPEHPKQVMPSLLREAVSEAMGTFVCHLACRSWRNEIRAVSRDKFRVDVMPLRNGRLDDAVQAAGA